MKKIAVLGLGTSLKIYFEDLRHYAKTDEPFFAVTIGVNDIWQHVHVDAIVCLENFHAFTPARLQTVRQSKPKAFFSQKVIWDTMPGFRRIEFLPGYPEQFCTVDRPQYHKSYCSPFVACQVAYKVYGATEIHLYGVDLVNHPHLDAALCAQIKKHFRNLKAALTAKDCALVVHGNGILKDL